MNKKRKNRKNKKTRNKKIYVDPYELKGEENTAYLKEIAGLTALLGAGTVGATFMPTGRVAAASSVDPRSRIVGSVAGSALNFRGSGDFIRFSENIFPKSFSHQKQKVFHFYNSQIDTSSFLSWTIVFYPVR